VELTMAADPTSAVLNQLAACRGRLDDLEAREAAHHADHAGQLDRQAGMITTISRALADASTVLARLGDLERQVAGLASRTFEAGREDENGCQPSPAPAWWKLTPAERRAPAAELRDWLDHVYRPGYGHLAAALAPCWAEHDLCLYGLDIASKLWWALYLQPGRTTAVLAAQAEYQVRILPAIAAQLAAETARCGHQPASYHRSAP
jgi:hypothetical protein